MAIDLKDDATLTGRVIIDDTEYPNGKYKDADLDGGVPVANTGTPFRADERNDIEGFLGALLKLGGLDPSGVADAPNPTTPADSGQYIEALTNWFSTKGLSVKATNPTSTSSGSSVGSNSISNYSFPSSATSPLVSYLINGGLMFQGWVGDSVNVFSAEAEFNIDLGDLATASNVISYIPSSGLEMTGITATSRAIISCDLLLRNNGVSQTVVPMNPSFLEGSTYLLLSGAQGFFSLSTLPAYTSGILRIKYDPRYVQQP